MQNIRTKVSKLVLAILLPPIVGLLVFLVPALSKRINTELTELLKAVGALTVVAYAICILPSTIYGLIYVFITPLVSKNKGVQALICIFLGYVSGISMIVYNTGFSREVLVNDISLVGAFVGGFVMVVIEIVFIKRNA